MPSRKRSAESVITFTQSATVKKSWKQVVSEYIPFLQLVDSVFKVKALSDSLTFTQTVSVNTIINETAFNIPTFAQSVLVTKPVDITSESALTLTQTCHNSLKGGNVSNTISFVQVVSTRAPVTISATNNLYQVDDPSKGDPRDFVLIGLDQDVSLNIISNITVTNYMQLRQLSENGVYDSAANHIHLSQLAEVVLYETPNNVLQPMHSVVVYNLVGTVPSETDDDGRYHYSDWLVMPVSNDLTLTSTVTPDQITEKPLTSALSLQQAVDGYVL
jgi:hypothetical protein